MTDEHDTATAAERIATDLVIQAAEQLLDASGVDDLIHRLGWLRAVVWNLHRIREHRS